MAENIIQALLLIKRIYVSTILIDIEIAGVISPKYYDDYKNKITEVPEDKFEEMTFIFLIVLNLD